jgi:hypothetical protein
MHIIPPLPEGGGGYLYCFTSVRLSFRLSKIFFVAFFSVTVDIKIRLNRKFESTEFETMRVNCMFNVYKSQLSLQTGSRNLTGPKTLISSNDQNCFILSQNVPKFELYKHNDELFNIYYRIFIPLFPEGGGGYTVLPLSVLPSVQDIFRRGPKTLPTIWGTYMNLVTKYQISAINSC